MEVVQEQEEPAYNESPMVEGDTMQENNQEEGCTYGEEESYQFHGPDNMVLEMSQDHQNQLVSSPGVIQQQVIEESFANAFRFEQKTADNYGLVTRDERYTNEDEYQDCGHEQSINQLMKGNKI